MELKKNCDVRYSNNKGYYKYFKERVYCMRYFFIIF